MPDLHPERAANRALLNEGWMVATTSYRRNGIIIADAIDDLDALRAFIADTYGEPAPGHPRGRVDGRGDRHDDGGARHGPVPGRRGL